MLPLAEIEQRHHGGLLVLRWVAGEHLLDKLLILRRELEGDGRVVVGRVAMHVEGVAARGRCDAERPPLGPLELAESARGTPEEEGCEFRSHWGREGVGDGDEDVVDDSLKRLPEARLLGQSAEPSCHRHLHWTLPPCILATSPSIRKASHSRESSTLVMSPYVLRPIWMSFADCEASTCRQSTMQSRPMRQSGRVPRTLASITISIVSSPTHR